MKVYAILAEYASYHTDGTFTVVRAGLDRIWNPTVPVQFTGVLVVRMNCEFTESGSHAFEIKVINSDGKEIMPRLSSQFNVPHGGGYFNVAFRFSTTFPEFGDYFFCVMINGQESERLRVNVFKPEEKKELE